jgi:acetyl-CoA carboxylase biotin carboxyl carrier protein
MPKAKKDRAFPMANEHPIDPELVRELANLIAETNLTEIEVEKGDLRIRVARAPAPAQLAVPVQMPAAPPAPAVLPASVAEPAPVSAKSAAAHPGAVVSPMVGTVYRRPSPDAKPFVEIGSRVEVGDKVLLVEAMKTFNEITAPRAGVVTAVFVEDGQPVEYGEPLLLVE